MRYASPPSAMQFRERRPQKMRNGAPLKDAHISLIRLGFRIFGTAASADSVTITNAQPEEHHVDICRPGWLVSGPRRDRPPALLGRSAMDRARRTAAESGIR